MDAVLPFIQQGYRVVAALAPLIVGATLVLAGMGKVVDSSKFRSFLWQMGLIPRAWTNSLLYTLPLVEIALGFWVVLGDDLYALAAGASFSLLAVFTVVSLYVVASGASTSCGCFGSLSGPMTKASVYRNAILATLAGVVLSTALANESVGTTGPGQAIATLGVVLATLVIVEIKRSYLNSRATVARQAKQSTSDS